MAEVFDKHGISVHSFNADEDIRREPEKMAARRADFLAALTGIGFKNFREGK
jgi:hypothetical protein